MASMLNAFESVVLECFCTNDYDWIDEEIVALLAREGKTVYDVRMEVQRQKDAYVEDMEREQKDGTQSSTDDDLPF